MSRFPDDEGGVMITCIELFAGAGGMARGLEMSGIKTEMAVESNKDACDTLVSNTDWRVINKKIQDVDFTEVYADIVSAGIPCQSYSYAGNRKGLNDERGGVFYDLLDVIKKVSPRLVLIENVKGLKTQDNGKALKTILAELKNIGYGNQFVKVLNTVDYGIPQKRERLIIIASTFCEKLTFKFPEKVDKIATLRDVIYPTMSGAGYDYPLKKKEIFNLVPPGGCWRDLPEPIKSEYMGNSLNSGGGKTGMARRLKWEEPSLTLLCSPTQRQTERCHPEETRPLNIPEYAAIQTFEPSWIFRGSISSQYRQIGNAFPVEMARMLGVSILEYLNKEEDL